MPFKQSTVATINKDGVVGSTTQTVLVDDNKRIKPIIWVDNFGEEREVSELEAATAKQELKDKVLADNQRRFSRSVVKLVQDAETIKVLARESGVEPKMLAQLFNIGIPSGLLADFPPVDEQTGNGEDAKPAPVSTSKKKTVVKNPEPVKDDTIV